MITNTRYKGFLFDDDDQFINDDYRIEYLKDNLIRIFTECSFYFNDYSLNNIILHLIITIDRLRSNYFIEESQLSFSVTEVEQNATEKIVEFLEKTYGVEILPVEKNNIAAVLSSNLATLDYRVINRDNVTSYIRKETVELVDYILEKTTDYYMLDPFDDVFFARFSLHVDNLLKRLQMNHSIHNPMVMNIKLTYPLIFDIAVYAAALIEEKTGFRINQDEISLLALHIGSFIESSDSNRNKVSAIYVYSDYHQFYQHNITTLQTKFEKELNILYTISINDYRSDMAKPDLVISEVPLPNSVTVSPFITDEQIERIQKLIRSQAKLNESDRFVESLGRLFPRERFFMDLPGNDAFEIIQNLTSQLKDQELFDDSYVESVMNRERISSTCFVKKVAIPHAIGHSVKKSFISAITYSEKRIWGTEPVFLVILFGISYTDRKDFRFVFNHIVELLSKEANINAFCRCRSYDELMDTVKRISHSE